MSRFGKPRSYNGQLCAVDGCDRLARSHNFCVMHNARFERHGDPLSVKRVERLKAPPGLTVVDRLMLKVVINETTECHEWQGYLTEGYGRAWMDGKSYPVHRLFYALFKGPIPEGMTIDHICHNNDPYCVLGSKCPHRRCVNIDHLELATPLDNSIAARESRLVKPVRIPWNKGNVNGVSQVR